MDHYLHPPSHLDLDLARLAKEYHFKYDAWQIRIGRFDILAKWLTAFLLIQLFDSLTAGSKNHSPSQPDDISSFYLLLNLFIQWLTFGFSIFLITRAWRAVPRIGEGPSNARTQSLMAMAKLGRWIYHISGFTVALAAVGALFETPEVWARTLGLVSAAAMTINAIAVNYCIRQWAEVPQAQRDIAKLVFRMSTLFVVLNLALVIRADTLSASAVTSLTILFVPFALEGVFVVQKSKPRPATDGPGSGYEIKPGLRPDPARSSSPTKYFSRFLTHRSAVVLLWLATTLLSATLVGMFVIAYRMQPQNSSDAVAGIGGLSFVLLGISIWLLVRAKRARRKTVGRS